MTTDELIERLGHMARYRVGGFPTGDESTMHQDEEFFAWLHMARELTPECKRLLHAMIESGILLLQVDDPSEGLMLGRTEIDDEGSGGLVLVVTPKVPLP